METTQPSPVETIAAIKKSFEDISGRIAGKSDRESTEQVIKTIGNLGKKYKWGVCASGFPPDPEWLYDLIWFRNDSEGRLSEVYLVMESEWGKDWHDDIKYDFEKLFLAKATLKIFVCQTDDENGSRLFDWLEKGILAFQKHTTDETYILAIFNNNIHKFEMHTSKFEVSQRNEVL